jgi:hypothetical protein
MTHHAAHFEAGELSPRALRRRVVHERREGCVEGRQPRHGGRCVSGVASRRGVLDSQFRRQRYDVRLERTQLARRDGDEERICVRLGCQPRLATAGGGLVRVREARATHVGCHVSKETRARQQAQVGRHVGARDGGARLAGEAREERVCVGMPRHRPLRHAAKRHA